MQPDTLSEFHPERRAALEARGAGRRQEALERFRAASRLNPADRWTRNDVALELFALGRTADARAEAETLRTEAPDFGPARRTLGLLARADGDAEAALDHFRAAAERDTRDLWNRHDAAQALKTLGRPEEAAAAFHAVADGTPFAHTLRGLGELARDAGRHEEALDLFRAAARFLPADPWFALDAASALDRLERRSEADAAFADIRARHPGFVPALRLQAQSAVRRRDHETARRLWAEAVTLAPEDAGLDKGLAEALLALGRFDEAETRFLRVLLARPGDAGACLGLARIARLRGANEIAAAHLKAAEIASTDEPFVQMAIAAEWLSLGEMFRARRLYGELGEGSARRRRQASSSPR